MKPPMMTGNNNPLQSILVWLQDLQLPPEVQEEGEEEGEEEGKGDRDSPLLKTFPVLSGKHVM